MVRSWFLLPKNSNHLYHSRHLFFTHLHSSPAGYYLSLIPEMPVSLPVQSKPRSNFLVWFSWIQYGKVGGTWLGVRSYPHAYCLQDDILCTGNLATSLTTNVHAIMLSYLAPEVLVMSKNGRSRGVNSVRWRGLIAFRVVWSARMCRFLTTWPCDSRVAWMSAYWYWQPRKGTSLRLPLLYVPLAPPPNHNLLLVEPPCFFQ